MHDQLDKANMNENKFDELSDWAKRFASETLAPNTEEMDRNQSIPAAYLTELCKKGLGGMILPPEIGGAGLSYQQALSIFEHLALGDMPVAFSLLCQNSCARSIWQYGTDKQRKRWIPTLMSGEKLAAYAITEPNAGSDPGSMSTQAQRQGTGWKLNGQKAMITNAPKAGLCVLSAKTNQEQRGKSITSFLISSPRPGLDVSDSHIVSASAMSVGQIKLHDCEVEDEDRLGAEGEGMRIALDAVNWARMIWGGLAAGIAQSALNHAIDYSKSRKQFGHSLFEFQHVAFTLADMATEIVAARQLAMHAARAMDQGNEYLTLCAMTKQFASKMAVKVTSQALELRGGWGYVLPNHLERLARHARLSQLADGTSNIQRLIVARSL